MAFLRVNIRLKWVIIPFCRCSKILGEAGKHEILQQMFRKFWFSNRLPNRYLTENCRWVPLIIRCSTNIMLMKLPPQLRHGYSTLHLKQAIELHVILVGGFLLLTLHWSSGTLLHVPLANVCRHST